MNRAEQLKATQETLAKLLELLQSSEADKFVAHLYQARKQYRRVCERPNKGNRAVEREVISTYQIAQSFGFKGDFRQWEHWLLDRRPIAPTSCGKTSSSQEVQKIGVILQAVTTRYEVQQTPTAI